MAQGFSAGLLRRVVRDEQRGIDVSYLVLYPSHGEPAAVALGPYVLHAAENAPPARGLFPLLLFSHGNGGWHVLYRELALHLVSRGYVVALPEHHGNNRNDNTFTGTHENLEMRPRHLRLVLQAVLDDALLGAAIDGDCIAAGGHSLGGYTALALAGGQAWTELAVPVDVEADARLKALVLLAPAGAYFMAPGALATVDMPIFILCGEHDDITPDWQAALIRDAVPDARKVAWRTEANAGHFSFLSEFPPAMRVPSFPPANDPPGFDRAAFLQRYPREVGDWLDTVFGRRK